MRANNKKNILFLSMTLIIMTIFSGCSSVNSNQSASKTTDISELPIYPMRAAFVYNTDDVRESIGISDYVFVGEVISCDGTLYKDTVTTEDENGNPKDVSSPYTKYTINVIENIKGQLVTEEPISITKHGGVSNGQDAVYVFENDELPVVNNSYIFLAYAQEDGSLLISGPNSNTPYNSADTYSVDETSVYQEYKTALESEVIPVERERFTSIYDDNITE